MQFWIQIDHNWKKYRYLVKYALVNDRIEHFMIQASNKTITIESNRPLFRNKGLNHRRPDYKLIKGEMERTEK